MEVRFEDVVENCPRYCVRLALLIVDIQTRNHGEMDLLVKPTDPPTIRRKLRIELATARSAFRECARRATRLAV
jgi:hypothetical protein